MKKIKIIEIILLKGLSLLTCMNKPIESTTHGVFRMWYRLLMLLLLAQLLYKNDIW